MARMGSSISHRGPDGCGVWVDDGIALAHQRLAIIDIVGGAQPMVSSSGRWVLVFNGEIYNFNDLKKGSLKDYRYVNNSDTEVILAALEKWGGDGLRYLEGMFALAAWDRESKRLLLARDGQGIKPLYYSRSEMGAAFGSEIKALLAAGIAAVVDEDSLDIFLDIRFVPSSRTMFKGVYRLPPGHFLWIGADGAFNEPEEFSGRAPLIDRTSSIETFHDLLHDAMLKAVGRQMVADVPVGILLSGGVDSAAVTAAATRSSRDVATFCVGYADNHPANEFIHARETARLLRTEHHELIINAAEAVDSMGDVIGHLEEPVVTTSMFSYYLLCREVAKHRKVVLTGQGADEPWGGYGRHRVAALADLVGPVVRTLPNFIFEHFAARDNWIRLRDSMAPRDEIGIIKGLHSLFPGSSRNAIRTGTVGRGSEEAIADILDEVPSGLSLLERLLAFEVRSSLPDNLLLLGDKLSMASGLEVRVPLLDPSYLSVVERVPGKWRRGGVLAGTGKLLHKKVCSSMLPSAIVNRPKKGFQSPIDLWLKQELGDRISDMVESRNSFSKAYLNIDEVRGLLTKHRRGDLGNLERQCFAVWILEEWYAKFFSAPHASYS